MPIAALLWPLAALLAALGLCRLAPPRARTLYLAPVSCTVTVLFAAAAYVAAVWSH